MSTLQAGEILEGKYRVIKLLGEGGMNRVYLVEDLKGLRRWALKFTRDPVELQTTQPDIYNKFLKEVSMLMNLKHPNLPVIEDYFPHGTQYCIVEEYIKGTSLENYITHNLPDERTVIEWALTLCDIFDLLHKNNVIFRDLKPANIILTKKGDVKLIDFDIARYYSAAKSADTAMLGTPGYAAPEMYGQAQSDARSDIYTLGATLHHLITGVDPQDKPFHFAPISTLRQGISPSFCRIVEKCLKNKPAERFQRITDVRGQLLKLQPAHAPAPGPQAALMKKTAPASGVRGVLYGIMIVVSCLILFRIVISAINFFFDGFRPPSRNPVRRPLTTPSRMPAQKPAVDLPPLTDMPPGDEIWDFRKVGKGVISNLSSSVMEMDVKEWYTAEGNSTTLFHDTYVKDLDIPLNPLIKLSSTVIRAGEPLHVRCAFPVTYNPYKPGESWPHTVRFMFGMPADDSYLRSRGTFYTIPGRIRKFTYTCADNYKADNGRVIVYARHYNSWNIADFEWIPSVSLPSLKYDSSRPWKGPRVIISAYVFCYNWQYTSGFVILAKNMPAHKAPRNAVPTGAERAP